MFYYDVCYCVEGMYCHQTSNLLTIITKQIHHRLTTKKDNEYMEIYRREESRIIQIIYTEEHIYNKKTTDIHNNNTLRSLYTGINIHHTQTHMIAEPFDSSVRMK